jgi:hypothetical protein
MGHAGKRPTGLPGRYIDAKRHLKRCSSRVEHDRAGTDEVWRGAGDRRAETDEWTGALHPWIRRSLPCVASRDRRGAG